MYERLTSESLIICFLAREKMFLKYNVLSFLYKSAEFRMKKFTLFPTFRFRYMVMADDRQRLMPHPKDRVPPRGKELAYPEAVLLVDPVEPEFKGEVYI